MESNPKWLKYFFPIGDKVKNIVANWQKTQVAETSAQKEFLEIVKEALDIINYDYRIATIEPSMRKDGKLFFKRGRRIYTEVSAHNWEAKAKRFAPYYKSDIANIYELFIWYAYRIAMGYWTLSYVCDDSSSDGNYWDSPNSKEKLQYAGRRRVGGFVMELGMLPKL